MEGETPPRLVLFPGLAADGRMFGPQRRALPWVETPDLPEPRGDETMADYGGRVARLIAPDPPMYLGGVSYGAALALEAARHLPARGVFLIGGLRTGHEISWPFRLLLHGARYVPDSVVPLLLALFPIGLDLIEELTPPMRDLYVRMARETTPNALCWGAKALLEWEWTEDLPVPVWHIQGAEDWVIPIGNVKTDAVVRGGRHLINLTHPQRVNAYLAARMGVPGCRGRTLGPADRR